MRGIYNIRLPSSFHVKKKKKVNKEYIFKGPEVVLFMVSVTCTWWMK